jgi:hypothetical protein
VFNENSENNRCAVTPASIARQLSLLQDSTGIEAILLWSGSQTPEEMRNAPKPVEEIHIDTFLTSTGVLPWPGCPPLNDGR